MAIASRGLLARHPELGRPWVVSIAYGDLAADARVIRETKEELKHAGRVTLLVPRSNRSDAPSGLERAQIVWLPTDNERGRSTFRGQLRFIREVRRWCRQQTDRPDVVHVHNMPDYLYWSVREWQRAGAHIVVDVHDIMSELALHRFRGLKRRIAVPILRWVEGWVWRRADHLITVHDLYRAKIVERGLPSSKITVVLNSPDPSAVRVEMRRRPRAEVFKIAFHGTVTRRSGIVHAVQAMSQVRAAVPNAQLVIVGTGEASADVRHAIAENGLGNCVEFSDSYLPLAEAIERIADADVGLVPNEVSQYTAAMLPVKLTEYASLGIPCVSTALPLVETYFGSDAVELIRKPEPPLIAEALIRLARDPLRRAQLSEAALRFTRMHGWSRYSKNLISAVGIASEPPPLPEAEYSRHALQV